MIVEHLERMSRQLQQTQDTVDSLRRMLTEEERIEVLHRDEPAATTLAIRGDVTSETVVTWWIEAFTELHRLARGLGRRAHRARRRRASRPSSSPTAPARWSRSSRSRRSRPLPGRVEVVERPAARYAVATYDGPMVDLDAAYSAVGRAVTERALVGGRPGRRALPAER